MFKIMKAKEAQKYKGGYWVSFNYSTERVEQIKSLGQRWYIPSRRVWEIPEDELTKLVELVGAECVTLDTDLKEEIVYNIEAGDIEVTEVKNRLKDIKPVIEFDFKTKPFPHQIEAFNYGLEYESLLIADEQGLGKTKESIDIAVARKLQGVHKCLIICGVNSVKYNWQKEVSIHSDEMSSIFDAEALIERKSQLENWLNNNNYFGIINIESLRNDGIIEVIQYAIKNEVIGLIIVDEIHKAKNGQSQQGKALRFLHSRYKIGLTGTPIMNRAEDLWNILAWLGIEKRNMWIFKKRFCVMGGFMDKKVVGYKNLDELHRLLQSVMLRRKKEEVLDLPPKIRQIEYIDMSEKHKQVYNSIRQGIIAEIDEIALNPNPLTSLLRLRQCTGGVLGEDNPKLDRLKELIEGIVESGKKAIIFSQWTDVTEMLKEKLKEYNPAYITGMVKDRQGQVNKFQEDDSCKLIIGTIGAMGTGLTLTKASYVIFMDKAWTPADNEQAEDRAHRIGTVDTVNVITLVARNTVDEKIEEQLLEKKDIFNQVVEGTCIKTEDKRELLSKLLGI